MAQHIKPASISGLNTSHPLYADIHRFYEFGLLDKELVTDTALTISGAAVVDDADIGVSRAVVPGASVTQQASIPQDCTILVIMAGRGTRITGGAAACDIGFLRRQEASVKIGFNYSYGSGGRFAFEYDGATGATRNWNTNNMSSDADFLTGHAIAAQFGDTETLSSCVDGTIQTATNSTAGGALGSPPVSIPFFQGIGTTANFPVGAIVVFNRLLTNAEMQTITSAPWALVAQGPRIIADGVVGSQGAMIIARSEQDIVINVVDIPSGQVPVGAGVGSVAGVGGTAFTGVSVAAGTTAGTYQITADVPVGVALAAASNGGTEVYVEYDAE